MGIIDSILNFIGILLWFNWRSGRLSLPDKPSPVTLAATLKKAEVPRGSRWVSLGVLLLLVGFRSLLYWQAGSSRNWTPSLELGVISLPFRSDYPQRMVAFSILSFALVLAVIYSWLLLISLVNHNVPSEEPSQRLVRWHLGWVERWPLGVKMMLPLMITAAAWLLGSRGLVRWGIIPAPTNLAHLCEQAVVLGVATYLVWKPFLIGLCILYTINSYVYLGKSPFWGFVNLTGANLLAPLRRLGVQIGKVDLSPIIAIVLVITLTHLATRGLTHLFQHLPI